MEKNDFDAKNLRRQKLLDSKKERELALRQALLSNIARRKAQNTNKDTRKDRKSTDPDLGGVTN